MIKNGEDLTSKNMLKVYGRHVRIGAGGCTKIGLSEKKIDELRKKFGNSKDSTFLNTDRNPLLLPLTRLLLCLELL